MAASDEHTKWVLDLVDGMSKDLRNITENVQGLAVKLEGVEKSATKVNAIDLSAIAGSFESLHNRLNEAVQPGIRFQASLAELSAMTGVTGAGLEEIGDNARALTKELGGEAADSVEAYKLLLSQLTPELAQQPALLNNMAKNAILLGKTMGGDTAGAVEVLTSAMNAFQVDMDNPIEASREMERMMNVMAAAAAEGSAELPQLREGLMEAGADAKRAGLSFEETAAALEVLDKGQLKGSRGGVALRNVLSTLSQGRFLPDEVQQELAKAGVDVVALGDKTKSLKDRLELLKPVYQDTALMTKLFGRESAGGANALISMSGLLGDYTTKVSGTNTATEQATTIMGSFSEQASRMRAWVADVGISIFDATKGFLPYTDAVFGSISVLADLRNAQMGLSMIMDTKLMKSIGTAITAMRGMSVVQMLQAGVTGIVTAATAAFNAVLAVNPLVWVAALVVGLVGALIYAWNHFDGFRAFLFGFWESTKVVFSGIWEVVKAAFGGIIEMAKGLGGVLGGVWDMATGDWSEGWDKLKAGALQFGKGVVDNFTAPLAAGSEVVKQSENLGLRVGLAYAKGDAKGRANFKSDKAKDAAINGATATGAGYSAATAASALGTTPALNAGSNLGVATGKSDGKTVAGSGSGDKNISVQMTLNQRFDVDRNAQLSLDEIANKVAELLTNRMRDVAYTL